MPLSVRKNLLFPMPIMLDITAGHTMYATFCSQRFVLQTKNTMLVQMKTRTQSETLFDNFLNRCKMLCSIGTKLACRTFQNKLQHLMCACAMCGGAVFPHVVFVCRLNIHFYVHLWRYGFVPFFLSLGASKILFALYLTSEWIAIN